MTNTNSLEDSKISFEDVHGIIESELKQSVRENEALINKYTQKYLDDLLQRVDLKKGDKETITKAISKHSKTEIARLFRLYFIRLGVLHQLATLLMNNHYEFSKLTLLNLMNNLAILEEEELVTLVKEMKRNISAGIKGLMVHGFSEYALGIILSYPKDAFYLGDTLGLLSKCVDLAELERNNPGIIRYIVKFQEDVHQFILGVRSIDPKAYAGVIVTALIDMYHEENKLKMMKGTLRELAQKAAAQARKSDDKKTTQVSAVSNNNNQSLSRVSLFNDPRRLRKSKSEESSKNEQKSTHHKVKKVPSDLSKK